ncbi:MAG: hypothetical protein AAGG08_21520 [Actinomycetota bacterium]
MERLCERPGCSEPASVAYGMRPEDLVFWLDHLRAGPTEQGVLCRRHADTMVVPRGWTLDDLREPDLHLFRPPTDDSGPIRRPRTRRTVAPDDHHQLALVDVAQPVDPPPVVQRADPPPVVEAAARGDATEVIDPSVVDTARGGGVESLGGAVDEPDDDSGDEPGPADEADAATEAWMPRFDTDDDLDGLLAARGPLLSRAFRGERDG